MTQCLGGATVECEIAEVRECAAFGVPDERLGERLVAVVVANSVTEAEIIDRVGRSLARYKVPTRVALSATTLPRNAVGKVDKVGLRKVWPQLSGEQ